ncbi:unnamed protein product [Didymodactylos carnosus]|uniref:Uncharacterized protein n=1 Tax=Didymodactylos carnosus TaxID=1234261 RepID=A0A813XKR3_9BILA|nr:unnamed protein product [Didymodactylos carnosus]CAF3661626.1 unnamed protein product [Didymodactylos carnosus]
MASSVQQQQILSVIDVSADPILWTGTEFTRSTSAGNFRLYKDASGIFGIWVPNSPAFYSDGIPPNISAPDTLSGQMTVATSHRPVFSSVSSSSSKRGRLTSLSKAVTPVEASPAPVQCRQNETERSADNLTPEQRRALANRKRHDRRNRIVMAAQAKIVELQKQLDEKHQTVSSIPDEDSKDDDVFLASHHQPTSSTLVVRLLKTEENDVENLANDMERLA